MLPKLTKQVGGRAGVITWNPCLSVLGHNHSAILPPLHRSFSDSIGAKVKFLLSSEQSHTIAL